MNAHSQKPQKTTRAINGVLDQILGYARRIAAKSETVGASGWPRMRTLNQHTVLKAIAPIVAGNAAENFLERLDAMALIGETHSIRENPSTRLNASKNRLRARLRHQIRIFGDGHHIGASN